MSSDNNEERWLWLAEAVATGEAIDWAEVAQRATDDDDRAVIQALRNVSDIACAHTSLPLRTGPAEESGPVPPDAERWRHLQILERVAQGTFGVVYRARDEGLDREVALKLSPRRGDAPGANAATLHEARLLARVRHPNVVTVYGADAVEGRVGLWMEFVHGRTLEDVISAQGPFGAREAAAIGIDLCNALAAVHRAGLLHRDLKCRNVMREEGGRIVLMDFGAGADVSSWHSGAQSGVAGTPAYLAPEVFEGGAPSAAGDIYSLGVLLFHLVSGSYPIEGRTQDEIVQAHVRRDRHRLRDVRPDLPDGFLRVVERALAHAPSERPQTAGALADDLAACMGFHRPDSSGRGIGISGAASRHASTWLARGSLPTAVLVLLSSAVAAAFWWSTTAGSRMREGQTTVTRAGSTRPLDASGGEAATYSIGAQFHVANDAGRAVLLSGDQLKPGDRLFLTIDTSIPVYAYVINQDDKGESYLLFPLPGQTPANPLPPGRMNRLPGARGGEEFYWQVTSAGGREHFFVFASPQRVRHFEDTIARLPPPELDKPVVSAVLPERAIGPLRGVGGLAKAEPAQAEPTWAGSILTSPLLQTVETTRGLWARKIVFENPGP